jgi:hypothetical protein
MGAPLSMDIRKRINNYIIQDICFNITILGFTTPAIFGMLGVLLTSITLGAIIPLYRLLTNKIVAVLRGK